MASVGIRNPLSPYDNYRDCSLGICSIYCTQFCFFIFPPPPPSSAGPHSPFSPSIIALIFVLAGAFLLVSYYTILKTRRGNDVLNRSSGGSNNNTENEWAVGPEDGMEASLVEKITEYNKGGRGLIEGTECAVCLGEFREGEMLRLLPKCKHAFHLPCIDKWLKSQSSCPLCRGNVAANNGPDEDLVLVVEDGARERTVAIEGSSDNDHEGVEQFRRSDVLKFEEIQEYVRVEIDGLRRGIGSSEGDGDDKGMHIGNLLRSPVAMKRSSVSTGRFMGRGNNSVILIN